MENYVRWTSTSTWARHGFCLLVFADPIVVQASLRRSDRGASKLGDWHHYSGMDNLQTPSPCCISNHTMQRLVGYIVTNEHPPAMFVHALPMAGVPNMNDIRNAK
ncbi:uncharacterized protein K489DRAFT_155043 [Dissoconium aciculare CBS 342.82]|uniref:Uncharacterized protein n=1 Tax=Dissoconium aciculare CBS 342.82 TaxID=1314786 RepID=A0A6J3MBC7_9PEZI|nr:uncharacterized protein K489DRAFT_155043 [Dissoconium aciculare CBS 342.82]KAF1825326.1 hypothetical protein K489DRAFT_155043 [Dissoconium aciculare CBS 342.82]